MQHVFISYKHTEDLDFAENVYNCLKEAGFTVWIDHHIHAGEEWRNRIDQALRDAFALVAIMTPEAKASEYVTYEWAYASGAGIRVIPLMRKKTSLHPRLEAYQYLDFTNSLRPWDRLIAEVRAVQATITTTPPEVKAPSFIEQARAALNSPDASTRLAGITTLAQASDPATYEVLLEALSHPIADVRQQAANALGEAAYHAAIPGLCERLRDPDGGVRLKAIKALGQIRDTSTITVLVEAFETASSEEKIRIVDALSAIDDPAIVPTLLKLYKKASGGLRTTLILALGKRGDSAALPLLKEALQDPEPIIRQKAIRAMLQIEDEKALKTLTDILLTTSQTECEMLLHPISPASSPVQSQRLIVYLGDVYQAHQPASATGLLNHNEKQLQAKARRRIIWIFGRLKDSDSMPTLIEAIDDPDKGVVYEAVRVMKLLGARRALPAFVTVLRRRSEDFDEPTLLLTVQALGQLGNIHTLPELKTFLREMLAKRNIELTVQTIYALGKLGDYETINFLRNTMLDDWLCNMSRNAEIPHAIDQAITEIRARIAS